MKKKIEKFVTELFVGPIDKIRRQVRAVVEFSMMESHIAVVEDEIDEITDKYMKKLGYY